MKTKQLLFLILFLVAMLSSCYSAKVERYVPSERVIVTEVIDGDTFLIASRKGNYKVRLIGVDAPEIKHENKGYNECYGQEAKRYLKSLIEGKEVVISIDLEVGNFDKYGRLLRYAYIVNKSGSFDVGLKLLKEGYAELFENQEFEKKKQYIEAEQYAKENKKGLWSECS